MGFINSVSLMIGLLCTTKGEEEENYVTFGRRIKASFVTDEDLLFDISIGCHQLMLPSLDLHAGNSLQPLCRNLLLLRA